MSAVSQSTRRLAEYRAGHRVISLYLDLDPERFATAPARSSQIRSLIDDARRRVDRADSVGHEERVSLRADLKRIDAYLKSREPPFQGARALAVFCSGRDDLFEVVQLPRATAARVVIEAAPYIEPLVAATTQRRWGVILVNRRIARLLTGSTTALHEHDQLSLEKDADDHLRRAADLVHRCWRREPFDRLAIGGPSEVASRLEAMLHEEVRACLASGRVEVDVATAGDDRVRVALEKLAADDDKRVERDALDQLAAGIGSGGRAAGGPEDTVTALNERRVSTLLLDERFDQPAARCRSCGLLVLEGNGRCPIDGSQLEGIEHLREAAVEAAIAQDAEVMVVTHYPDLGPFQGIGALLRF